MKNKNTPVAPSPSAPPPPVHDKRLSVEEFVLRAIEKLASPGKDTIHTVYTGFNDGFRKYFPGQDPIEEVKKLVGQNKISFRFCRGGALIGKPGSIARPDGSKAALEKMGL
jgi:hypothetical protein